MLTIDWKERLKKDAEDFATQKLPNRDYNFEIIYKAYPARVHGKVPSEVIAFVAQSIAHQVGKKHDQYLAFYEYLWDKKGESGKLAFTYIISKYIHKKPEIYFPMVEKALSTADPAGIILIMDKILQPLLKKHTKDYLPYLYKWVEHHRDEVSKQAMNALLKLIKKDIELLPIVLAHFQHGWSYPIEHHLNNHILLLKAIGKIDREMYLKVFEEYKITRDPQTVEILCGSVYDYCPELCAIVENWTHSGNARLKKAAVAAFKVLNKKKKA